jgi:hypothetical protein
VLTVALAYFLIDTFWVKKNSSTNKTAASVAQTASTTPITAAARSARKRLYPNLSVTTR